jgi:hypothetical protein
MMPFEEQQVISLQTKMYDSRAGKRAAARWTAAVSVLLLVIILPLWLVRYVPLYDYQNHLLESQVLIKHEDPQMNYSSFYEIREGWYLRSNALTTIMMAALGQIVPMEYAGKIVLSFYFLLLGFGFAILLYITKRPTWLILFLPVLAYNFTFTAGMLNWSFGFALTTWVIVSYLLWRERKSGWFLAGLALLLLFVYVSHLLAWGLALVVLFTLSAFDGLHKRDMVALLIASASAAPMLILTRPMFALSPLIILVGIWFLRLVFMRLNLSALTTGIVGAAGVILFMGGIKIFQEQIQQVFPDIGYSSYSKAVSITQTFALPHHHGSQDALLIPLNLFVIGLLALSLLILIIERGKVYMEFGVSSFKWMAVCFVLLIGYFLIPTRTHDIIVTEPRLLLFAFFFGLMIANAPLKESHLGKFVLPLLSLLALSSLFSIWYYFLRYDEAAQSWANQLNQVPSGERLLVFSDPLPDSVNHPLKIGQIFDQNQFANTYPLETGGFTSNTFFNGPLLPVNPSSIPPYWWIEFRPGPYVNQYCERLHPEYDYVLLWNPRSSGLLEALNSCYGVAEYKFVDFWVWKSLGE